MVILNNYVSEQAEAECPPEDIYTLKLTAIGDLEEKQSTPFRPGEPDDINTQSRFTFQIVDFDYDPDEDERDWNGLEVFAYPVFFRRKFGEDADKNKAVFKSERANSYKLLTALGFDVDSGDNIPLDEAIGQRIKATLQPKQSGWPKIVGPTKTRQRRRKTEPQPEPADDTFDEDE